MIPITEEKLLQLLEVEQQGCNAATAKLQGVWQSGTDADVLTAELEKARASARLGLIQELLYHDTAPF